VLIAATAVEHGLPVVTQDDDYDQIAPRARRPAGRQGLSARSSTRSGRGLKPRARRVEANRMNRKIAKPRPENETTTGGW
jgi:hypothetical protein